MYYDYSLKLAKIMKYVDEEFNIQSVCQTILEL